jgi:hypothetical protein
MCNIIQNKVILLFLVQNLIKFFFIFFIKYVCKLGSGFLLSCLNISPQWRNMALQSQERRSSKLTNHLLASIGAIKKSTRNADNKKI